MTAADTGAAAPRRITPRRRITLTIAGLAALALLYTQLQRIADLVAYDVAALTRGSHVGAAVEFFTFEVPKVLLLLTAGDDHPQKSSTSPPHRHVRRRCCGGDSRSRLSLQHRRVTAKSSSRDVSRKQKRSARSSASNKERMECAGST